MSVLCLARRQWWHATVPTLHTPVTHALFSRRSFHRRVHTTCTGERIPTCNGRHTCSPCSSSPGVVVCGAAGAIYTNDDFGDDGCNIFAKGVGSPTAQLHSSVLASLHCLPPTWTLASGALHPLQPNDRARERRSTTHAIGRSRPSLLPAPTLGCALA